MNEEASVVSVALGLELSSSSFKHLPRWVDLGSDGTKEGATTK